MSYNLPRPVWLVLAAMPMAVAALMGWPGEEALANPPARKVIAAPVAPEGPRIELTLADAVSLALRDNRTIKSAYLQRIVQKFDLRVAEDRYNPHLVFSSSYLARRTNGEISHTVDVAPVVTLTTPTGAQLTAGIDSNHVIDHASGRTTSTSLNLTIIQPLLRGGGVEAGTAPLRIAQIDERINRLNLKLTVSRTITEVILAYRDFLKTQEQVQIAEQALKRSRALLDVNRTLIDAGRMAAVEIVQTEADLASQEYTVEEAKNQLDASRLSLLSAIAVSPRTDIVTADKLSADPVKIDLTQALAIALENYPEYLTQLLAIERAKMNVTVAKNQRLWDLSIVGGASLGRTWTGQAASNDSDVYGGLQLVVPFGDLSGEQGEVSATVALRTAEVQMEAARQQLEQQTRDAVRNVNTRWRQLELARKARDLAARKLEVENEKLKFGRSSNFQVLSFENDLRNAENARLGAQISYLNALTILDQQLGMTLDTWRISLEDRP